MSRAGSTIGYYVHHHGRGHLHRAGAVARHEPAAEAHLVAPHAVGAGRALAARPPWAYQTQRVRVKQARRRGTPPGPGNLQRAARARVARGVVS